MKEEDETYLDDISSRRDVPHARRDVDDEEGLHSILDATMDGENDRKTHIKAPRELHGRGMSRPCR